MNKPLRCISWCAVSSQEQAKGVSLADQSRENRQFIDSIGEAYPGYTGALVAEFQVADSRKIIELAEAEQIHPEYRALLNLVRSGQADVVVCRSRNRLGRRGSLIMAVQATCYDHGVIVCPRDERPSSLDFARNQDDDGLNVIIPAVGAAMSEIEMRRLQRLRTRGLAARVRAGKFPFSAPAGYYYAYRDDGSRYIARDEAMLRVIRILLWDLYAERGLGYQRIAEELNAMGHRSPTGRPWSRRSVSLIVQRAERYGGIVEYNKEGPGQYVAARGDYEPILTEDELATVIAERSRKSTGTAPARRALTGAVVCGACGRTMRGWRHRNYVAMCCDNPECTAKAMVSERKLWAALREKVAELSDGITDDDLRAIAEEEPDQAGGLLAALAALEAEQVAIETGQRRTLRAYAELGALTEAQFVEQMAEYTRRAARLEREIEQAQAAIEHSRDAGTRLDRLEDIRAAGLAMLDLADDEPDMVRGWLRRHFVITVDKARIQGNAKEPERIRVECI